MRATFTWRTDNVGIVFVAGALHAPLKEAGFTRSNMLDSLMLDQRYLQSNWTDFLVRVKPFFC